MNVHTFGLVQDILTLICFSAVTTMVVVAASAFCMWCFMNLRSEK